MAVATSYCTAEDVISYLTPAGAAYHGSDHVLGSTDDPEFLASMAFALRAANVEVNSALLPYFGQPGMPTDGAPILSQDDSAPNAELRLHATVIAAYWLCSRGQRGMSEALAYRYKDSGKYLAAVRGGQRVAGLTYPQDAWIEFQRSDARPLTNAELGGYGPVGYGGYE